MFPFPVFQGTDGGPGEKGEDGEAGQAVSTHSAVHTLTHTGILAQRRNDNANISVRPFGALLMEAITGPQAPAHILAGPLSLRACDPRTICSRSLFVVEIAGAFSFPYTELVKEIVSGMTVQEQLLGHKQTSIFHLITEMSPAVI